MKKIFTVLLTLSMLFALTACGGNNERTIPEESTGEIANNTETTISSPQGTTESTASAPSEVQTDFTTSTTVAQDYINMLSSALVERWSANNENDTDALPVKIAKRLKCVSIELEKLLPFTDKSFEDKELEELAHNYITLLQSSKKALEYFSDDENFLLMVWGEIYHQRCALIYRFVNEYNLSVAAEHTATLDEMVIKGMVANKTLEKIHLAFGQYCYELMPYYIEAIDDGLLSVQVGTPEFKEAVQYLVPEYIYANAKNGDEKILLIHDYLDGHKRIARYFTVDRNGNISIEVDNVINFVLDCQEVGLFSGVDQSNFATTEEVQSLYSFSEKLEITEFVVVAMLYAIDSVSYEWSDSMVNTVLSLPGYSTFLA